MAARWPIPGPASFYPYDESERALLRAAICEAADAGRPHGPARQGGRGRAPHHHAPLPRRWTRSSPSTGSTAATIGVVGFHGQTVLHRPEKRLTIQIGAGAALATALHLPVVWDMRAADVAAGGQGAPLVPAWHRALVEAARLHGPVLVINLGGRGERHLRGRRRRSHRLRHRPRQCADRRPDAGAHGRRRWTATALRPRPGRWTRRR